MYDHLLDTTKTYDIIYNSFLMLGAQHNGLGAVNNDFLGIRIQQEGVADLLQGLNIWVASASQTARTSGSATRYRFCHIPRRQEYHLLTEVLQKVGSASRVTSAKLSVFLELGQIQ